MTLTYTYSRLLTIGTLAPRSFNALESWMYKMNRDCPARLHPPWLANACAKSGQCMSMLSTQLKMTVTVLISDVRPFSDFLRLPIFASSNFFCNLLES